MLYYTITKKGYSQKLLPKWEVPYKAINQPVT